MSMNGDDALARIDAVRARLREIGCTDAQLVEAMQDPSLAESWLGNLDRSTGINRPAGFVLAGIRTGKHPFHVADDSSSPTTRGEAPPFPDTRVVNAPWAWIETCDLCQDDGTIEVAFAEKSGTEEMAPCPNCQKGFMVEFGYGRREVTIGNRVEQHYYRDTKRSPWGQQGYWWRNTALRANLQERAVRSAPLPPEEHKRRSEIMERAFAGGGFSEESLQELYRDDPDALAAARTLTASAERREQTDWSRQRRERLVRKGIDPRKFHGGATDDELELYEMLRPKKTDESDAAS